MIDAALSDYGITITTDGADLTPGNFQSFLSARMLPLYGKVEPGWKLLIDVRASALLDPEGFQIAANFIANSPKPPAKIAIVVESAILAMQLSRLYRTARGDQVRVFDRSVDPQAFANAEASLN
jgi:hypothetical protein